MYPSCQDNKVIRVSYAQQYDQHSEAKCLGKICLVVLVWLYKPLDGQYHTSSGEYYSLNGGEAEGKGRGGREVGWEAVKECVREEGREGGWGRVGGRRVGG